MVAGPILYPSTAGSATKKYSKSVKNTKYPIFPQSGGCNSKLCDLSTSQNLYMTAICKCYATAMKNYQKLLWATII